MMEQTRVVKVRESILARNRVEGAALRDGLSADGIVLVNLMSSPGSGKTSLILRTVAELRAAYHIAVIEADIDSTVDADKVTGVGIPAVQLETGGFCHAEAAMVAAALNELDGEAIDLLFLENVGNLICTAQHDTGAHINVAILSVPEGDDKPLKYPVMFTDVDLVLINKIDFLPVCDFDPDAVRERVRVLNPRATVISVSCRTGDGLDDWAAWLCDAIERTGVRAAGR